MSDQDAQAIPPGFDVFIRETPLLMPWRPLYSRTEPDRLVIALRVREPHTNTRGTVHGGLFAALADQAMGMSCSVKLRAAGRVIQNLWTTSMAVEYLGVAALGQWLSFETTFSKCARSTCYAEADIAADGQTVCRARASFRIAASEGQQK